MPVLSSNTTRNVPLQVMIPIRLIDALNRLALDRGLSRSALIREALEKVLFTDAVPAHMAGDASTTTMREDN